MIIPGFNGYDISEVGVVTKVSTGEAVKSRNTVSRGILYKRVSLRDSCGTTRTYNVLALLAYAYLGKRAEDGVATAKDGNNLNTVLSNVEWLTRAEMAVRMWEGRKSKPRKPRQRCYSDDSIDMVYNALCEYDTPVTVSELSSILEVPYSTVRYSIVELRKMHKVRKTKEGFEVIR